MYCPQRGGEIVAAEHLGSRASDLSSGAGDYWAGADGAGRCEFGLMSTGAASAGGRRAGAAALRWACLGAGVGAGVVPVASDAARGSAFMMLTGGIDEADGKNTSGPGTRKPTAGAAPGTAVGAETSAGGGDDGARPATGTSAAAGQPAA